MAAASQVALFVSNTKKKTFYNKHLASQQPWYVRTLWLIKTTNLFMKCIVLDNYDKEFKQQNVSLRSSRVCIG